MIYAQLEFGVVALSWLDLLGMLPLVVSVGGSLSLYIDGAFLSESFPLITYKDECRSWTGLWQCSVQLSLLRRRMSWWFSFIQQSSTVERLNNAEVFFSKLISMDATIMNVLSLHHKYCGSYCIPHFVLGYSRTCLLQSWDSRISITDNHCIMDMKAYRFNDFRMIYVSLFSKCLVVFVLLSYLARKHSHRVRLSYCLSRALLWSSRST